MNEVQPGPLESYGILPSIFSDEEAEQIIDLRPSHFISRSGIRNNINNAALNKFVHLF